MREGFIEKRKNEEISKKRKRYRGIPSLVISLYLLIFTFSTFLGWSKKVAAGMNASEIQLFVDCVTVEKGDTLWSIAKEHHSDFYSNTYDYVIAIKECNGLKSDLIKPGMNIMVPYTERR